MARSEAGVDGNVDAVGVRAFDVAYPSTWKFSVEGPISGYFLAINTSADDLEMNTLELKSIDDDHPTAIVRVTVTPSVILIPPGRVGGHLSGLSTQLLVDSGLVMEPRSDTTSDYLSLAVENAPEGTYDINVDLVIAIEGVRVPMPLKIQVVPLTSIFADPVVATRTAIYR